MANKGPKGGWKNYILDLVQEAESLYKVRNDIYEDLHEHRMMRKPPTIPAEFEKSGVSFHAPLVYDLDRRIVALINNYPVPKRIPLTKGADAQAQSSKIEKWLSAFYREAFKSVYPQVKDALVADGMGVFKVILDKHVWGGIERGVGEEEDVFNNRVDNWRRSRLPFRIEHVASKTYCPIGDGTDEVLEISHRSARPISRQYKLVSDGTRLVKPRDLGTKERSEEYPEKIKFIEYWNKTNYVYMVDETIVEQGEHNYGRPPYFPAYATITSSHNPSEQGLSFAFPLMSLEQAVNDVVTMRMNWERLNSYPSAVLEPISEDVMATFPEDAPEIEITPGGILNIPPGFKFRWVEAPSTGRGLVELQQLVTELADKVSLAPILSGISGSDQSNAALVTVATIAKSIFGTGLESLANAFDEAGAFVLELIDRFFSDSEPVSVFGIKNKKQGEWMELRPKDINGYYKVSHNVSAIIPAEQFQKGTVLNQAYSIGAVSMRYLREEGYALEAPEEMDDERFQEDFLKWPEVRTLLAQKFIERVQGVPPAATQTMTGGTPPGMPAGMGGIGAMMNPGMPV